MLSRIRGLMAVVYTWDRDTTIMIMTNTYIDKHSGINLMHGI
jgi:hypothetical protein